MTELNSGNDPLRNPGVDYERQDAVTGRAVLWGGAVLLLVFVAMLVVFGVMGGLSSYQAATAPTPLPLLELRPTPPAPRLQPNPIDQLSAEEELLILQEREEEILNNYEWVDQDAGLVRIPIERAIELLAEEPPAVDELPK
jgi:hypothetical protein